MVEPAESRPADLIFPERQPTIRSNKCMSCKGDATEFKDELSKKEYSISGLCQKCQDKVFG